MKTNPAVTQGLVVYYRVTGERCKVMGIENIDDIDTAIVWSENDQDEMAIDVDRFWDEYVANRDDVLRPRLQVKSRFSGAHYEIVAYGHEFDKLKLVVSPVGSRNSGNPDLTVSGLTVSGKQFWDVFEPLAESDVVKDSDDDVVPVPDSPEVDVEDHSLLERFALDAPVPFTTSQRHDLDVAIASNAVDDVAAIMDRNVRLRYDFAEAMMRERAKRTGEQ